MHSPPEILFSTENMQSAMEKFERSGAWNLPVVENNTYLGFVSLAKIFNAYRKILQRQKEEESCILNKSWELKLSTFVTAFRVDDHLVNEDYPQSGFLKNRFN